MKKRYIVLFSVVIFCAVAILIQLCNLQLVNGAYYSEQSEKRLLKTFSVEAPRGDIYDRYGRIIVGSRQGYSIQIQRTNKQKDEEINSILDSLIELCASYGVTSSSTLPIEKSTNGYVFSFSDDESGEKQKSWAEKNLSDINASPNEAVDYLINKYKIENVIDPFSVLKVRYEMQQRGFSPNVSFTFAKDVGLALIASIKEQSYRFKGVNIVTLPIREYPNGTLASHILGRTGSLDKDEYDSLKNSGYMMNDTIGKQGLEKHLESYLRGENGVMSVEQTDGGRSVNIVNTKSAVKGDNVRLTIDIELQKVAEEALAENIHNVRANATSTATGSNAFCGAIVVMDVRNGEILAIASYPTYNPVDFSQKYGELATDFRKPLLNRAISGAYEPGSTFKMLTAIAGLEEGVITPSEVIIDQGVYRYYTGYQPRCWIYSNGNATHGAETVSEAIRDSCNYFFYETGRRLTIENIDKYATLFGLGENSGIELESEERTGNMAGPESRKKSGQEWYPGDTLQTAIGQSDTLITPIQLVSYISTVANGGTRYRPHLVKQIISKNGKDITVSPEVLAKVEMKDSTYRAVTNGMHMVVTEGTARSAFMGCNVDVAAKTGSAQLGKGLTNGVFVAYAPFEKPQIAVAAVIEKAGGGGSVAPCVRKVIEAYFNSEVESDTIKKAGTLIP